MKHDNKESIVYTYIYELTRSQYRSNIRRHIFKRFIRIVSYTTFFISVLLISVYLFIVKPYIDDLKRKLDSYDRSITRMAQNIELMKMENIEYRTKLNQLKEKFSHLKIENNKLIDIDLTETIKKVEDEIDSSSSDFKNFFRGSKDVKETALTFDLGTGEELPFVYRTLKSFRVRATIFVTNGNPSLSSGSLSVKRNIYYLKKLAKIGCEFGNHTWSHYNLVNSLYEASKRRRLMLTPLSDTVIDRITLRIELKRVEDTLNRVAGIKLSHIWRAPYGAYDDRILKMAAESGYKYHIFWSFNRLGPLDFYDYVRKKSIVKRDKKTGRLIWIKNPYYFSSADMFDRLKKWEEIDPHGLNGAISIAHLGTARRFDKTISILPEYIAYYKSRGYRFVTITELIRDSSRKISGFQN